MIGRVPRAGFRVDVQGPPSKEDPRIMGSTSTPLYTTPPEVPP